MRARRRVIVVLAIAVLILVLGFVNMAQDIAARPVTYSITTITPLNPDVCPGETLRYPVTVEIVEIPSILTVVETWCKTGSDGVCSTSLARTYQLPLLDYRYIETIATRLVPVTPFISPGEEYELWHAADGTGYIVTPIKIRTDCDAGGTSGN